MCRQPLLMHRLRCSALASQLHSRTLPSPPLLASMDVRRVDLPRLRSATALAVLIAVLVVTYRDVLNDLVRQWASDDNYSHGFLVVPLAIYFGWQRRAALAAAERRPSLLGLVVVLAGVGLLVIGVAASELFLSRISLPVVLAGCIAFLFGVQHLRVLALPLGFLLLMIPLPTILFNQIAFPLQLFASGIGEVALRSAGVPVVRDGNVLELATLRLEVVEACSGIRSFVSLLMLAVVIGQFGHLSPRRTWALAAATVPVAVAANAARVAGTGLAAHAWGKSAAEGFLHAGSGTAVFLVATAALLSLDRLLRAMHTDVRTGAA
jgi:exosortase